MPNLLEEIEAFLDRHAVEKSPFGGAACGDRKLVSRLQKGAKLRRMTIRRVREYMAAEDAKIGHPSAQSTPSGIPLTP